MLILSDGTLSESMVMFCSCASSIVCLIVFHVFFLLLYFERGGSFRNLFRAYILIQGSGILEPCGLIDLTTIIFILLTIGILLFVSYLFIGNA